MDNNTFEYTYSAKQQKEIEEIKKKYLPKEEDKLETLRKLDRSAETPGTIVSLVLGVVGLLIFGGGMSLCMVGGYYILGILLALVGIAPIALAYPMYRKITKAQREKIAPQILALSEEISKS